MPAPPAPTLYARIPYTTDRPGHVQSLPVHSPCARYLLPLPHLSYPAPESTAASLPRLSDVHSSLDSTHRRVLHASVIAPSPPSIPPIPRVPGSALTCSWPLKAFQQYHTLLAPWRTARTMQ